MLPASIIAVTLIYKWLMRHIDIIMHNRVPNWVGFCFWIEIILTQVSLYHYATKISFNNLQSYIFYFSLSSCSRCRWFIQCPCYNSLITRRLHSESQLFAAADIQVRHYNPLTLSVSLQRSGRLKKRSTTISFFRLAEPSWTRWKFAEVYWNLETWMTGSRVANRNMPTLSMPAFWLFLLPRRTWQ